MNKDQETSLKKAQNALEVKDQEWKDRMKKVIHAHNELENRLTAMEKAAERRDLGGETGEKNDSPETLELKNKVEELELEINELTQESLELASQLTKAQKEMEIKNESIRKLQGELEAVKEQPSFLKGWGKSASAKSSQEKATTEEEKMVENQNSYSSGGRELSLLRGQVADLERQLKGAYAELDSGMSEDVQKLRNQLRVTTMAKERAEDKLSVLETIEEKSRALEGELRAKRDELSVAVIGLDAMRGAKEEAQKEAQVSKEQMKIMEGRLAEVVKEKEEMLGRMGDGFKARKQAEEAASKLAGQWIPLGFLGFSQFSGLRVLVWLLILIWLRGGLCSL